MRLEESELPQLTKAFWKQVCHVGSLIDLSHFTNRSFYYFIATASGLAQAVQLQVKLVMTLRKAVIESSALLPVVKKMMNRWQRAPAFLLHKKLILIQNVPKCQPAELPVWEACGSLKPLRVDWAALFLHELLFPPHLEVPKHSTNSQCSLNPGLTELLECAVSLRTHDIVEFSPLLLV